jgi:hypothetical protein
MTLVKSYEIPYPFKMHHEEDKGVLNYHLSSFIPKHKLIWLSF